jgi:hypothetical protein
MGYAPPNCKFSGLLRYKHSKGPKGLQFFIYTQRANSDLRVLHCDTYSGDINYPNNTVIPEREGTNDVGSECVWGTIKGGGHTMEITWEVEDDRLSKELRRQKLMWVDIDLLGLIKYCLALLHLNGGVR